MIFGFSQDRPAPRVFGKISTPEEFYNRNNLFFKDQ